jgi:Gpi18-like mannosyltransferase
MKNKIMKEVNILLKYEELNCSLKYFLISKSLIFIVTYFTLLLTPITNEAVPLFDFNSLIHTFETIAFTGDTGWYRDIILNGYTHEMFSQNNNEQRNWAFFPFFPIISIVIGNEIVVWIILQLVIILSGIFIYKIAEYYFDKDTAKWSVIFFMYWPWAYMQSSLRAEAFLTLFWLITFYFLILKKYYISSIFAFLSALVKPNGFLISFFALIHLIKLYKTKKKVYLNDYLKSILVMIAGPLGVLVYSIYIYDITGDFLAWAKIQSTWGTKFIILPFEQIKELFLNTTFIGRWGWDPTLFNWMFFFLFIAVMLNLYKYAPSLVIFSLIVSLLSFSNFGVWVQGRHLISVFPLFIGLAIYFKSQYSRNIVINIFIVLIVMISIYKSLQLNAFTA